MKDRYTIGEVADLLNMSPQSLRFYDKAGVVVPAYTNPKTGALASRWRISGTLWTPTT